ncbi:MAG TPA: hypothetical protein VGI45_21275 [Terracidiphilus sp.]
MKELDELYALGKAKNASIADFPAIADKFTLRQAAYVKLNICQNLECQHVSLTFHSHAKGM